MGYVEGERLSSLLKQPTADENGDVVLNAHFDENVLDTVYQQIAEFLLQITTFNFNSTGAISERPTQGMWTVTGRPLAYNMNEIATVSGYPMDEFPSTSFSSTYEYLEALGKEHLIHFRTQRNLADDEDDARRRYLARKQYSRLIQQCCVENGGPFKLFCDDLQPSNMLADPHTFRITAVLDFEFTNSMPSQFAYDAPWWVLLLGPDMWLERRSIEAFTKRFEPQLDRFIKAMERAESSSAYKGKEGYRPQFSALMRDSWRSGRFCFNYGIRKSVDVDAVYWAALHRSGFVRGDSAEETPAELESIVRLKMDQLRSYKEDCLIRFR